MITAKSNVSLFARYFWLTMGMFVIFVGTFVVYVRAEKLIDRANELRQLSFVLAEELRQSSDDLTRMVRTYVVTGDPIYKQHYQEILDIRDGKKPRPVDSQNVYWDVVMPDDRRPRLSGPAVPLLKLMQAANFTVAEFAKLAEAKANSDALTRTEFAAMALIESKEPTPDDIRAKAILMLHDAAYHQAKAGIMRPISEFNRMADQRTLAAVHAAETYAIRMRLALIVFGALFTALLWNVRRNLWATLGATMQELHSRIVRLGSGDFVTPIPVAAGMEDSVLGWLSETQSNLARIDCQRRDAAIRNQRLTQLYAALSQCNQAIVRSANEEELFGQVCRTAVTYGGMSLAWVGEVDKASGRIKPVAWFGRDADYLNDLWKRWETDNPNGRGPTAEAIRKDEPCWYQDFQHDPATARWHEVGARYGWGSSAALPLHRGSEAALTFAVYADAPNAFDEDARNLIVEMVTDIEYALKNFDLDAQRKHAEESLRKSEQQLRTIIETEPECIATVDATGQLLQMNAAGLAMLESDSLTEVQQHGPLEFILPENRAAFLALHQRVMKGESGYLEYEILGLKGTRRSFETYAAPLRDPDGSITLLAISRDITARKQAESRIQYLANHDALTGLPNRAQLEDLTRHSISLAHRNNQPVTLMFLDLDRFKDINDTLGHSVGDQLLIEMARRLRSVLRAEDAVARVGGDEFIFWLHGIDAHGAARAAQKLLDIIAKPFQINPNDLNVTGSIGIALYPDDGESLEDLLRSADAAMYRAKQEGRHCFRYFTSEMQAHSARNLQLVNALRLAPEHNQLQIHYQPQVSIADQRIIGVEALLRWTHPELGAVSPTEFIPVAEDSGLILVIGEWVLRQAVRQAKSWMQQGLPPLIMAVNLSAVQFRHPNLPNLVTQILNEEGLPPEYLELELTEGVAMHDPQSAIAVMNNLHERGVRMSIDDFGTGYSSLSLLKKFKIYKLKIDQSFIRDISTDPEDRAIVVAVIQLAYSLGLQTIAEGVETAEQLAFLRDRGCNEMQGYFYSKPLPADQFEVFARTKLKKGLRLL